MELALVDLYFKGQLNRFVKRCNIGLCKICGKSDSVIVEVSIEQYLRVNNGRKRIDKLRYSISSVQFIYYKNDKIDNQEETDL